MAHNKYTSIFVAVGLVVLGVIAGAVIGAPGLTDFARYDSYDKKDFIDSSTYQAVFLTNDQTYFGLLKDIKPDYLLLSDVHYVRVTEVGSQIVKLGEIEPHGPKDVMVISKSQVLFWGNLRPDSQVVKIIRERN